MLTSKITAWVSVVALIAAPAVIAAHDSSSADARISSAMSDESDTASNMRPKLKACVVEDDAYPLT